MAIDITTKGNIVTEDVTVNINNMSETDLVTGLNNGAVSEAIKQDMFLMKNPLSQTYKQHYSRSLKDNKDDLIYEERPYTFLYFVPPDCTGIDYDYFDAVNADTNLAEKFKAKIDNGKEDEDKEDLSYAEIASLPIDLKSIHPDIRKMLLQQTNYINASGVKTTEDPNGWNIAIPIMNNFFIPDSITSTDIEMATTETANTVVGFKHVLPTNTFQSRSNNTFSVDFQEISSKKLGNNVIANMTMAWMRYIQNVRDGTMSPTGKYTIDQSYKFDEYLNTFVSSGKLEMLPDKPYHKAYNYMGSLYYFQLEPDGKTISYWSKWTGIYPLNINTSSMANNERGPVKTTVTFQTQYFEELDHALICEFNELNLIYNATMSDDVVASDSNHRVPTILSADANIALIAGNIHPSKDTVMELYVGDEINNIDNINNTIILSDMLSYESYKLQQDTTYGQPSFDLNKARNENSDGLEVPDYSYDSINK